MDIPWGWLSLPAKFKVCFNLITTAPQQLLMQLVSILSYKLIGGDQIIEFNVMSYTIGLQISNGLINSQPFIFNALKSYESEVWDSFRSDTSEFWYSTESEASEHWSSTISADRLNSLALIDVPGSRNYF